MNNAHVLGAIAALFLSVGTFNAAPARADTVFDFSGVCDSGCTGTATGVLTLVDFFDDDNGWSTTRPSSRSNIRPRVAASSSPSRTAGAPMASCTTMADLSGRDSRTIHMGDDAARLRRARLRRLSQGETGRRCQLLTCWGRTPARSVSDKCRVRND
jgi:hypothetical protein